MIQVGGKSYEVIYEHKNAWNPEVFRGRYSEILERYDYILGDWGYSQLRLKGFFRDNHGNSTKDTTLSGMMDYINEYCNFGCAYFVLEKVSDKDSRLWTGPDQGGEAAQEGAAAMEVLHVGIPQQAKQGISVQFKQNSSQVAVTHSVPKAAPSKRKPYYSRNRNKRHNGKGGIQSGPRPRVASDSKERPDRDERATRVIRS